MAKNPPKQTIPAVLCSLALHWSETDEAVCLRGNANGVDFSLEAGDEKRKELLEEFLSGKVVELTLSYVAFRQVKGKSNAKFVRFTERALAELESTFPGAVQLTDHNTWSGKARAGTITGAKLKKVRSGHELRLEAHISARWAVQQVLEGNFDRFSISWKWPERRYIACSVCQCEIRTNNCYHYPGETLLIDGKRRTVEWIFDSAVARECSYVNSPAVDDTYVERVRHECSLFDDPTIATPLPEDDDMNKFAKLAKSLGLPEDTGADVVIAAALAKFNAGDGGAELAELQGKLQAALTELADTKKAKQAVEIDQLFALSADKFKPAYDAQGNKIMSAQEAELRELAAQNLDWVRKHLASLSKVAPTDEPPIHTPAPTPAPGHGGSELGGRRGLRDAVEELGMTDEDHAKYNRLNGTAYKRKNWFVERLQT